MILGFTRSRVLLCIASVALTLVSIEPTTSVANSVSPGESDPRVIMDAVEQRERGDRITSRIHMVIIDSSGSERERVLLSQLMDFDKGTKQLLIFESPADVSNTGLLSVDYEKSSQADDQWLYLPSIRKTKRIAGGDKSKKFMGSDLTYADLTSVDPDDYTFDMLKQSTTVDGEDCWLIEAQPKQERRDSVTTETGYVRSHYWISKDRLLPLQSKMWLSDGERIKLMKFAEIHEIDGIWIPHKIFARTMLEEEVESTTILSFDNLTINDENVTDDNFSLRRLEQGL